MSEEMFGISVHLVLAESPFNWALSVFSLQKEDTMQKTMAPSEKVREVTAKTGQTKGPEAAGKNGASAAMDSCKDKKQQRNEKPMDKVKVR